MRGDGGAGCAAGGCGGASLVGLLVTLLLLGMLSSKVVDSVGGNDGDTHRPYLGAEPARVEVAVTPTTDLTDGRPLLLTSTAFPKDARVDVTTCLDPSVTKYRGEESCDPGTRTSYAVLDDGAFSQPYVAHRMIRVHGTVHDCAAAPGRCRVLATGNETQREVGGGQQLTFRAGLPPAADPPATDEGSPSDHLPIEITPTGPLAPMTTVRITARGFRPGEPVLAGWCTDEVETEGVLACAAPIALADALAAAGGDFSKVRARADAHGVVHATLVVKRRVRPLAGNEVDCTTKAGRCRFGVMAIVDTQRSALLPYTVRDR